MADTEHDETRTTTDTEHDEARSTTDTEHDETRTTDPRHEVTRLLQGWHRGDEEALDQLMPLVVDELRKIAEAYYARELPGHTLQPTALINEVYLRLVDTGGIQWESRTHFFGIAARLMRRVLVDHARSRQAAKRGGGARCTTLDVERFVPQGRALDLIALDDALRALERENAEAHEIVEMRYFAGLKLAEVGEVLGVSKTTVKRKWRMARLWLQRELSRDDEPLVKPGA